MGGRRERQEERDRETLGGRRERETREGETKKEEKEWKKGVFLFFQLLFFLMYSKILLFFHFLMITAMLILNGEFMICQKLLNIC